MTSNTFGPPVVKCRVRGRDCRYWPVDPGHLWFCVAERDGWTVCYRIEPRERRPLVVEVRVVPTPPGEIVHIGDGTPVGHHVPPGDGLTAGIISARLTVGTHVFDLLPEALNSNPSATWRGNLNGWMLASLGLDPELAPRRGRRGPKVDLVRAARVVAAYVDAHDSGSRSPALDAARIHDMTPEAVRATLRRARSRDGLLTKQTPGRAGGRLTPRAEAILEEHGRR